MCFTKKDKNQHFLTDRGARGTPTFFDQGSRIYLGGPDCTWAKWQEHRETISSYPISSAIALASWVSSSSSLAENVKSSSGSTGKQTNIEILSLGYVDIRSRNQSYINYVFFLAVHQIVKWTQYTRKNAVCFCLLTGLNMVELVSLNTVDRLVRACWNRLFMAWWTNRFEQRCWKHHDRPTALSINDRKLLLGNDEITRLNSDVTTTMNLAVVLSRVLYVLTYTRTTPVDSPSCKQYVETWLNNTVILPILFYHVNSAVMGCWADSTWYFYACSNQSFNKCFLPSSRSNSQVNSVVYMIMICLK